MELLFFAVFVKASPQDEHGVERPALSQGCGGGIAPHIIPSIPSISSISFIPSVPFVSSVPFVPLKSLTQVCHFFENFGDFSPVENFFELSTSYQQCEFFDAGF